MNDQEPGNEPSPAENDPHVLSALRLQQLEDITIAKDAKIAELEDYIERSEAADLIDQKSGAASAKAYEGMKERLKREFAESKLDTNTLIVVDLNNIKLINDTHGHPAGNDHLKDFVGALVESGLSVREIFRSNEVGDEFFILVPNGTAIDEVMRLAKGLFEYKSRQANRVVSLPTDFEYAHAPIEGGEVESAQHRADLELIRKKAERDPSQRYRQLPAGHE